MSFRQRMALLWAGLMGPAAELLPGQAARSGGLGALAVFAAGAVMALSGLLLGRLARREGDPALSLARSFGTWGGRLCLFLYIMWGEVLLTLRLRLAAQRLLGSGERDGAVWFFLAVLAAMAVWMARGHLGALGRAAQLMFTFLLFAAGAVLLLALFRVRRENLLPEEPWTAAEAVRAVLPGGEVLGYGLFAGFLIQEKGEEQFKRSWLNWTVWGCLGLAAAQTVMIGCFGPALTQRLQSPFFQLAKSVGVEGAFQRVECVVSAVWTFSDLLLLAGLLWGIRRISAVIWPKAQHQAVVTMAVIPAAVTAAALFREGLAPGRAGVWLCGGGLVFGLLIPLCAVLTEKGKGEKK